MTLADIRRALDVIDNAIPKLQAGAAELDRRARISSKRDGYPSRASGAQGPSLVLHTAARDPEEASAVDYSDPTAGAALTGFQRPDDVSQRNSTYVREILRMARAATVALAQLAEPTSFDDNEPWCANCARVKHADGKPHLEPVYSKAKAKTDVGRRLAEPLYLCRFDYDYILAQPAYPERTAKLPPLDFTTERLARGRAPRKVAS